MTIGERLLSPALVASDVHPVVQGKFLFLAGEKVYIRGTTYGTFCPSDDGDEYPPREVTAQDFARMVSQGINAVRTYTVPPRWLLDAAHRYGLQVMVGLPWEQHVAFLDERKRVESIEEKVRAGVRACAGHPAVLCYAIGNEIPAPIVRWHGPHRIERFLERLYRAAKEEEPHGLMTYVNYPSTEYLELPFVDFVCFNVYLESQPSFESYLARLHNLAGERPLIIAEIGLDSRSHGEEAQARAIDWQVRTAFAAGCAGAFVFAWTDEWYRGGYDIDDWDFGLTRRDRQSKPALGAVREAFADVPFPTNTRWPPISVVICSYNGQGTIRDCLEALGRLDYSNFEVIVVDDGSTDRTPAIAREYDVRLISSENRGLSNARNLGLEAATGEIVAYIDDDAYPDPHWLSYLAATFMAGDFVGVGGPNIAPEGDGPIADCVANAPGGPVNVLLSDVEAEHIAGCNMAFRKSALLTIGGFDPQFRVAGDDVDVCWRLRQMGWKLGYSPAAVVWHHRRNSIRTFWKQQYGYAKAEALLERKWPERFNTAGHLPWAGRLYGKGLTQPVSYERARICHGTWGTGFFQSLYRSSPGTLGALLLMPEYFILIFALAVLSIFGALWRPLLAALLPLSVAVGALLVQAGLSASHASFTSVRCSPITCLKLYGITAFLHLLQPFGRLCGRLRHGLTPWRRRSTWGLWLPRRRTWTMWSERWQSTEERLRSIEAALRAEGVTVVRGGDFDRWDLEVRGGLLGSVRLLMAVEEHGSGQQLVRLRSWPRYSTHGLLLSLVFLVLSTWAALDRAPGVSATVGAVAAALVVRALLECATNVAVFLRALEQPEKGETT
ncbi:MAG: glycosyltransferase [Chloroflexi bacterium]|nr:glycosyltransferase [Chloroflexota bacterium]